MICIKPTKISNNNMFNFGKIFLKAISVFKDFVSEKISGNKEK